MTRAKKHRRNVVEGIISKCCNISEKNLNDKQISYIQKIYTYRKLAFEFRSQFEYFYDNLSHIIAMVKHGFRNKNNPCIFDLDKYLITISYNIDGFNHISTDNKIIQFNIDVMYDDDPFPLENKYFKFKIHDGVIHQIIKK